MSSSARGFKSCRPSRVGAAALLSLLLVMAALTAAAQEAEGPAVVAGISIEIDGESAPRAYRDLVPIKVGEAFSPRIIDRVVKQIFQTGLFADVRVVKSGEERVELTFILIKNLFIREWISSARMCPRRSSGGTFGS